MNPRWLSLGALLALTTAPAIAQKAPSPAQLLSARLQQIRQAMTDSGKRQVAQLLPELRESLRQGVAAGRTPAELRNGLAELLGRRFKALTGQQRDLLLLVSLGDLKGAPTGAAPASPAETRAIERLSGPLFQETRAVPATAVRGVVAVDEGALAGGARPLEAQTGRLGEMVFTGKWRFQVQRIEVRPTWSYKNKFTQEYGLINPVADVDSDTKTFTAKDGWALAVAHCVVKNAVADQKQALWFYSEDIMTSVTDGAGMAYPAIAHDIATASFESAPLLPGAALEFDIVFGIPPGKTPKELIVTLRTQSDKGVNLRITLQAATPAAP